MRIIFKELHLPTFGLDKFSGEGLDLGSEYLNDEQSYDNLEIDIRSSANSHRNINVRFDMQWWKEAFGFLHASYIPASKIHSTIVILLRASQDGQADWPHYLLSSDFFTSVWDWTLLQLVTHSQCKRPLKEGKHSALYFNVLPYNDLYKQPFIAGHSKLNTEVHCTSPPSDSYDFHQLEINAITLHLEQVVY